MLDKIKSIVGSVAPFIGSLLGGPLGGAAGKLVSQILLGKDDATDGEILTAFQSATPDQLLALKKADSDYKLKMAELGLTEQKIHQLDRDSARKRQIAVKDYIPGILAIGLTIGFFGVLSALMFYPIQDSARGVIDVMLGALGTAWISVISYYFGSSAGSKEKTTYLATA